MNPCHMSDYHMHVQIYEFPFNDFGVNKVLQCHTGSCGYLCLRSPFSSDFVTRIGSVCISWVSLYWAPSAFRFVSIQEQHQACGGAILAFYFPKQGVPGLEGDAFSRGNSLYMKARHFWCAESSANFLKHYILLVCVRFLILIRSKRNLKHEYEG